MTFRIAPGPVFDILHHCIFICIVFRIVFWTQMVPTRTLVHICEDEPYDRVRGGYDLWFPLVLGMSLPSELLLDSHCITFVVGCYGPPCIVVN